MSRLNDREDYRSWWDLGSSDKVYSLYYDRHEADDRDNDDRILDDMYRFY